MVSINRLVSRSIDNEKSLNPYVGKGPVEFMLSKINGYALADELSNASNTGIIIKTKSIETESEGIL